MKYATMFPASFQAGHVDNKYENSIWYIKIY